MRNLILTIISLTFALSLSEGILRVFAPQPTGPIQFSIDSQRGPIPVPNQRARRTEPGAYSYTYTNNSLGLRGPEIGPKTKPRVLILGDSFTYGIGVNDDETFSALLQQRFPDYEIINGGNGGTGTDYALRFYQILGRSLQPDLVILCFLRNDFMDNQRRTYFDEQLNSKTITLQKPLITRIPGYSFLTSHSHLAALIKRSMVSYFHQPEKPIERNEALTLQYLNALRNETPKLLIFYGLEATDLGKKSEDQEMFFRLVPDAHLIEGLQPSDYLSEGHWNANGHRKAAESIANRLSASS